MKKMKFHQLFVPKSRQLKFSTDITIHSLDHVPMLSGHFYAKLKLNSAHSHHESSPSSPLPTKMASFSASPSSPRAPLRDHSVTWNWKYCFDADLTKNENGVLDPWPFILVIKLDRVDELKSSAAFGLTERIGVLHLDLAHFAGTNAFTTRKFLLNETKINSTLRLSIVMTLKSGDPLFKVPELSLDLQIDITRFAKSSSHPPYSSAGTTQSNPDILNANPRPHKPSIDVTSNYSHPSIMEYNSSGTEATPEQPSAVRPQSMHGMQSISSGSSGSSSSHPGHRAAIRYPSIPIVGVLPQLPAADPRPPSVLVDDLFARVLAVQVTTKSGRKSSTVSHYSVPPKSVNHSRHPSSHGTVHYAGFPGW